MVAKASGIERYIASGVWCLGRTYYQLGDHRPSYNHLLEAYRLFNTLPSGDLESQRLGGRCGIDLVQAARVTLQDKADAVSLARDVEEKCSNLSDDLVHGRSLVFLGTALNKAQQREEALVHLNRAKDILTVTGNNAHLATACQVISRVHYREKRLLEALDAIQEAWAHIELSANPKEQATISLEFGTILFSADRDNEAWKHIEIALLKASHIGNRLTIARALEYMGYGYLRRCDYQNAYGAYEAAAERYVGTIDAYVEKTCKENMSRIQQKQRNPDAVVGFYRPGYDVDKSLFNPCSSSICE
jgi:tetratricopeptide (TPR) repeat protein